MSILVIIKPGMIVFGHLGAADISLKHNTLLPNKVDVLANSCLFSYLADMKQH